MSNHSSPCFALSSPHPQARPAAVRLQVLVVEDHRDTADTLCLLFRTLGHDACVAYSGTDGVRQATSWRPDVVFCDIGLPGIDGFEVARLLRRQPGTEQALLVAVTAYGGEEDRKRGREAGFDHYLVKPVDPDDLRRLLADRVLHRAASGSDGARGTFLKGAVRNLG